MTRTGHTYHKPVLAREAVDALINDPAGVYADVTFGGGGHSRLILERLNENGRLFAFDKDADALKNRLNDKRFILIRSDFRFLKNQLRFYGIKELDGVLADLGISSHQIDEAQRGFSYRTDAPLDMRMNREAEISAYEVLNNYSAEKLTEILRLYGELKNPKRIAGAIVNYRKNKPIKTTGQLIEAVRKFTPKHQPAKFLSKLFQAFRIEVNGELEALKELLQQSAGLIKPGGKLVIITYHSLEDRLVKHFIRSGNFEDNPVKDFYGNITKPFDKVGKVIIPGEAEIEENPRARSAKMRIAVKR